MKRRLKLLWKVWLRFGQWIGDIVGRLILTVFYFTILVPFAVVARLFVDPLRIKKTGGSTLEGSWIARQTAEASLESLRRQS